MEIDVNFSQALADAKRLAELADEIKRIGENEVGNSISTVSCGWRSEQASRYLKKAESFQKNLVQTGDNIAAIAAAYHDAITKMKSAEDFAKSLAGNRTYH